MPHARNTFGGPSHRVHRPPHPYSSPNGDDKLNLIDFPWASGRPVKVRKSARCNPVQPEAGYAGIVDPVSTVANRGSHVRERRLALALWLCRLVVVRSESQCNVFERPRTASR